MGGGGDHILQGEHELAEHELAEHVHEQYITPPTIPTYLSCFVIRSQTTHPIEEIACIQNHRVSGKARLTRRVKLTEMAPPKVYGDGCVLPLTILNSRIAKGGRARKIEDRLIAKGGQL